MIDKRISVSEQVANLPNDAKLIFTWCIPHADDLGLLPHSLRTLKAMVIPMIEMSLEDFGNHVESIVSQKLFSVFEYKDEKYYRLPSFPKNQTLKKDRGPRSYIKEVAQWSDLKKIGFRVEDFGFQLESTGNPSEGNRRESKRSKVKGSKEKEIPLRPSGSIEYLKKIPEEDLREFCTKFGVGKEKILSKAEDLVLYCESKNKKYSNYRSFLMNALKRDLGVESQAEQI